MHFYVIRQNITKGCNNNDCMAYTKLSSRSILKMRHMKDSKGQYTSHTVHTKCRVVKLPRATISGLSVSACNLIFTKKNSVQAPGQASCTFVINLQGAFVLLAGNNNITLQPECQITFEEKPCCDDLP